MWQLPGSLAAQAGQKIEPEKVLTDRPASE